MIVLPQIPPDYDRSMYTYRTEAGDALVIVQTLIPDNKPGDVWLVYRQETNFFLNGREIDQELFCQLSRHALLPGTGPQGVIRLYGMIDDYDRTTSWARGTEIRSQYNSWGYDIE